MDEEQAKEVAQMASDVLDNAPLNEQDRAVWYKWQENLTKEETEAVWNTAMSFTFLPQIINHLEEIKQAADEHGKAIIAVGLLRKIDEILFKTAREQKILQQSKN